MDVHRMVIVSLGIICALCIGGIVAISVTGHEPSSILGYIATATCGALVGILVPVRNSKP